MELSDIPQELLIARGLYASARSMHEEEKQNMQRFCGELSAYSAQILRASQPANNDLPDLVLINNLIGDCREVTYNLEACAKRIYDLAEQRAELKPRAWPRGN